MRRFLKDLHQDERGESVGTKIGGVIFLALLIIIPWKIGGPIYKHTQLSSEVQKLVNWDNENRTEPLPDSVMLDRIYHRAVELKLPATKVDVDAKRAKVNISHPTPRKVRIVVEYDYPYKLPFFPKQKIRRIDHITTKF